MFDNDDHSKEKFVKPESMAQPKLLPLEKIFEYYLLNQESTREAYGLGMEKRKLIIVDREKLDKVPEPKKSLIREIWRRHNAK